MTTVNELLLLASEGDPKLFVILSSILFGTLAWLIKNIR